MTDQVPQDPRVAVLEALSVQGREDFYFFAKEICEFGLNPDPNGPRITEDQKELCVWLQEFYKNQDPNKWLAMILTPRDTLKSTVLQAFVLWLIVKNPDVRILLYGEVHEQAQKRLAVIKRVLQTCETFRDIYGNLDGSKRGLPWNENLFVSGNRKNTAIREGTVETAGLDVVVNSRHFDWIFPDDLHSEKNTKSKDQIEAVKEKVQLLMPLKSKGGKICVAGVFWNDADVHTWIKDDLKPVLFHKQAYTDAEHTKTAYPHALPLVELDIRKKTMRQDLFSCHYLLDPVAADAFKFQREYFNIIPKSSFRVLRSYLIIDQAGDPTSETVERRDSDNTGMVLWGLNEHQDMILLDGFMGKVSPTEGIEEAIHLIMRYKPYVIGVERAGIGNMAFYIKEELRKKGFFAIVADCKPQGRSKVQRVMSLEPYARRRKMFIADECPIKEAFIEEAIRFPKAKHDDIIDPTAYILDLMKEYGTVDKDFIDDEDEKIPVDLMKLNPTSQDHWYAMRKSQEHSKNMMEEFV